MSIEASCEVEGKANDFPASCRSVYEGEERSFKIQGKGETDEKMPLKHSEMDY